MSNTIGFTNFRRFISFPEMELGDITILVGGNNAGKSTLVKAMLLMRDFIKNRIESVATTSNLFKSFVPDFSFDTEHVNVGDFYRAFCRQSPRQEDEISFTMKIDKFRFIVKIRGERKPGIIPLVSMIAVSDEERNISFTFDFTKGQMTAEFAYDRETRSVALNDEKFLYGVIQNLKKELSNSKNLDEIANLKLEIEKYEKAYDSATSQLYIAFSHTITIDMSSFVGDNIGNLVIPELINGFINYAETGTLGDKRSKVYKDEEANKNLLRGKVSVIKAFSEEVGNVINRQTIEYIYAHSVSQTPFYANCAASSDYTKRTIHEFYNSRISSGDEEYIMIEEWLSQLKIGKSLKVIPYNGDNYRIVVFDNDNPEISGEKRKGYPGGIDLADKGMGTIQLVMLLLRLATLIRKFKGQQLTILLEEPEQNLHPALQSKLADLVYSLNKGFGINFVIETHSEYLIRKSQVIVADCDFKDEDQLNSQNPFRVFYIPSDDTSPYEMIYTRSGRFVNKFGEGFFDEAGKSNLITLRKEKEIKP